jgi:hypothetical protein
MEGISEMFDNREFVRGIVSIIGLLLFSVLAVAGCLHA